MKVVKPSFKVLNLGRMGDNCTDTSIRGNAYSQMLYEFESSARVCYQSIPDDLYEKPWEDTEKFVRKLIALGHCSVLEMSSFSVRFIADIGVLREVTRHRLCSFLQESTRYCNYSKDKFGGEISVIEPSFATDVQRDIWQQSIELAEYTYLDLVKSGIRPEIARSVLPMCTKSELVMRTNIRE